MAFMTVRSAVAALARVYTNSSSSFIAPHPPLQLSHSSAVLTLLAVDEPECLVTGCQDAVVRIWCVGLVHIGTKQARNTPAPNPPPPPPPPPEPPPQG